MSEFLSRSLPRPRVALAFGAMMLFSLSLFNASTIFSAVTNNRPHYNVNQDVCTGIEHLKQVQAETSTSNLVKNRLAKAESLYQKQLAHRDEFLSEHGYGKPGFSPWAKSDGRMPWWWYFQPAFNCPHDVERVGRVNDGGKWMCGMSVLERPSKKCVIYSLGVFDDSSFEAAMLERTDCEIWAFDASVDGIAGDAKGHPKIHFSKIFLGGEDRVDELGYVFKTLPTIMKENGHTWIDVLKMDIEGNEFQVMSNLMDAYEGKTLPFSQIQVELHLTSPDMGMDVAGFDRFKKWFERLEKFQLRPFWSELNLIPTLGSPTLLPGFCEYSFINVAGDHSLLHD
ncbi:MAG: methyltransferase domain-containing protein [Podila humilis]|nr:MAG: methyltransferase domain-containing protein [Podila humilis]